MKNELITYEQSDTQISVYSDVNLYGQYLKMAEGLSQTELVPSNFQGKPEACLIALDIARQIGCKSPLFVMQNLYVVKGKPSWSGQYCAAIIYSNFKNVQINRVGDKETGLKGCYITAIDKNGNECRGAVITIEMAQKEGWFSKKDKYGKETSKWQSMPEQMLIYRAFAFFARAYCPDKLLGMHDEFENEDITDIKPERSTQAARLEEKLSEIVTIEEETK